MQGRSLSHLLKDGEPKKMDKEGEKKNNEEFHPSSRNSQLGFRGNVFTCRLRKKKKKLNFVSHVFA